MPDASRSDDRLVELVLAPRRDTRSRLAALAILLERRCGKPKETIPVDRNVPSLTFSPELATRLTDAELDQAVALVTRLRQVAAEGSQMP